MLRKTHIAKQHQKSDDRKEIDMLFKKITRSPALIVALIAIPFVYLGTARAGSDGVTGVAKVTPVIAKFTVEPGQIDSGSAVCPEGSFIVSGGHILRGGNFVYITISAIGKSRTQYFVQALVPNKFDEPGALRAQIIIQAWCAPEGKPIVL